ncbi:MAG TPA: prolipoprotein diacylglyceryl transferase family protein [Phycisphaerae bacterium]|nr:prolipoprotein diacylglyceryl transferase family protein [Phycisphaerae bacterium]
MMPIIFRIPFLGRDLPSYGLMMMIGFMVAIVWAARRAAKSKANPDVVLNCGFIALLAGVVGCRFMYVVHYWDQFKNRGDAGQVFLAIIDVTKGGLEFYGGFILTVIAVVIWLRWREKVSLRWYLDIIAPSAALGLAFGRVGCLLNGCCFGGVCDLPWAVRFPFGSPAAIQQWGQKLPEAGLREELIFIHEPTGLAQPLSREILTVPEEEIARAETTIAELTGQTAARQAELSRASNNAEKQRLTRELAELNRKLNAAKLEHVGIHTLMKKYGLTFAELRAIAAEHRSLPVHPTQLYSMVTALLIALLLSAVYWRRTRDGQVVCALFVIQPLARWLIEVIRADNPVDTMGFTISQFLAVCMTIAGLIGFWVLRRMPPRSPRAHPWEPPPEEGPSRKKGKHAATRA